MRLYKTQYEWSIDREPWVTLGRSDRTLTAAGRLVVMLGVILEKNENKDFLGSESGR